MDNQEIDSRWRQVSSTRWERAADEAEICYATMAKRFEGSRRLFFAITGHISITRSISCDADIHQAEDDFNQALRMAWIMLRYDQPGIASRVEYSFERGRLVKIYETLHPHESIVESDWLKDTWQLVPGISTGVEFANSDPPAPKLATLFVIRRSTIRTPNQPTQLGRDLVLRAPHDVVDGVGTLMVIEKLLKHASSILNTNSPLDLPQFGSEMARLSPSLHVALGLPPSPTPTAQAFFQQLQGEQAETKAKFKAVVKDFRKGATVPGKHQRVEMKFSPEATTRLVVACKARGCSITHVYHAAIALLLGRQQPRQLEARTMQYTAYGLVNLRGKCQPPYNTPDHAVAVYHAGSVDMLSVKLLIPAAQSHDAGDYANESTTEEEDPNNFAQILETVKAFYHSIRDEQEHAQFAPLVWKKFTPATDWVECGRTFNENIPAPNPTPSVTVSSLGIIDKIIHPRQDAFEVFDPFVTGEELGTGLGMFLGTYRGELRVWAAYNDAFQAHDDVMRFLEDCHQIVLDGLDLGGDMT